MKSLSLSVDRSACVFTHCSGKWLHVEHSEWKIMHQVCLPEKHDDLQYHNNPTLSWARLLDHPLSRKGGEERFWLMLNVLLFMLPHNILHLAQTIAHWKFLPQGQSFHNTQPAYCFCGLIWFPPSIFTKLREPASHCNWFYERSWSGGDTFVTGAWCYCPLHPSLSLPTSMVKPGGDAAYCLSCAFLLDVSHCSTSQLKHTLIRLTSIRQQGKAGRKPPWKTIHTFLNIFATLWHVTTANSKRYTVFKMFCIKKKQHLHKHAALNWIHCISVAFFQRNHSYSEMI